MAGLLSQLVGDWRLAREVVSTKSSTLYSRMTGRARFAPMAEGRSRYVEAGELIVAGGEAEPVTFSRRYLYSEKEGALFVWFDEAPPRLFQRLMPAACEAGLEAQAEHACAPDVYRSHYLFRLPAWFEITHVVEGPRKDYTIRSRFEPWPAEGNDDLAA